MRTALDEMLAADKYPVISFVSNLVTAKTSNVFEVTGSTEKLDAFINLMRPLGLVDVSRTGVVAIARGPKPL